MSQARKVPLTIFESPATMECLYHSSCFAGTVVQCFHHQRQVFLWQYRVMCAKLNAGFGSGSEGVILARLALSLFILADLSKPMHHKIAGILV
mmetsp:Transcript_18310/g.29123  ORF Transcript_18310/g.29123 Transcript_18310/m.29123 type:complete len:93 (+) Transcript_18310:2347-2625(+)